LFDQSAPNAYLTRGRVGTPAFSSPEVLFEEDYGFEADLWAFGVILYEMLTRMVSGFQFTLLFRISFAFRSHFKAILFQPMILLGYGTWLSMSYMMNLLWFRTH
jgi:serine/threonine protein kinase